MCRCGFSLAVLSVDEMGEGGDFGALIGKSQLNVRESFGLSLFPLSEEVFSVFFPGFVGI